MPPLLKRAHSQSDPRPMPVSRPFCSPRRAADMAQLGTALGGGSRRWQPRERVAPPQAFIQGLARHTQQARGHALIAVGVPQRRGNQGLFGLFQGGEGLRVPRTLGGQRRD